MPIKSKGPKRKTRKLLRRGNRERLTINKYLQEFEIGNMVLIRPMPSSHKGMPFKRFTGKIGVITNKRGQSYIIKVMDGNKEKQVISRPEHIRLI